MYMTNRTGRVLTDVGDGIVLALNVSDAIEVAGSKGVEVRFESLQEFLVRMILDATVVVVNRRHPF